MDNLCHHPFHDAGLLQELKQALQSEHQLNLSLNDNGERIDDTDGQGQLTLSFDRRQAQGRADFVVSDCNRMAVDFIDNYPQWNGTGVVIVGAEQCGKTHLCHVWASKTNAIWLTADDFVTPIGGGNAPWVAKIEQGIKQEVEQGQGNSLTAHDATQLTSSTPSTDSVPLCVIIDNAHCVPDFEQLFHVYNCIAHAHGHVMMTARDYPKMWGVQLPDMMSRLNSMTIVSIDNPDDMMMVLMMVKLFHDRQVRVSSDVLLYAVKRLPRRYDSVVTFVHHTDHLALNLNRPITIPLVKQILQTMCDIS